eukprot:949325-Prymnesium_polylepis.1
MNGALCLRQRETDGTRDKQRPATRVHSGSCSPHSGHVGVHALQGAPHLATVLAPASAVSRRETLFMIASASPVTMASEMWIR